MAKVAVIVGAGSKHDKGGTATDLEPYARWGLGGALSLRFAKEGFHVVLMGRRADVLEQVATEVKAQGGQATPQICNVAQDASVAQAFAAAKAIGPVEVLVFNAAPGLPTGADFSSLPKPEDVEPDFLNNAFNVGVTGCLRCVRNSVPEMLQRQRGTILLTGATMALRGAPRFACMSPVKFALRSLGQSMFQEYAPQGVHVAHVVVDGVIRSPNTLPYGEKLQLQDPEHLADVFVQLHNQHPTVWTQELQVSPQRGTLGQRL